MRTRRSAPLSILVVENRADAAESTAELLALCGHAARSARTGAEALDAAAVEHADVVPLDLSLPHIDGWAVAAGLRARVGSQPVVITVIGRAVEADRRTSADAGIDLHLVKPVSSALLLDLLAQIRGILLAHQSGAGPLV